MSFTNLMHIILKNINAPISWDWQICGGWWGWEGEEKNLDERTSMQCLICWLFFTIKVITKHTLLKSFDWCWYIDMYIIWCYITCWMIVIIVYTLDSSMQRGRARLLFIKIINILAALNSIIITIDKYPMEYDSWITPPNE